MISLHVTYVLGNESVPRVERFPGDALPPFQRKGNLYSTLQHAIEAAGPQLAPVLRQLCRELVLSNLTTAEGLGGRSARQLLDAHCPDTGHLPGFVRLSGHFNAAGAILYNIQVHRPTAGYEVLPAVLSGLVAGGLDQPRCDFRGMTSDLLLPEELPTDGTYVEGTAKTVRVNAFERNARAREACLRHYGYDCICCGFNFEKRYGEAGKNHIHVHHIVPLSAIGTAYRVDPIHDLVPVCPNCHSIIHLIDPPYPVEAVKAMILNQSGENAT